MTALSAFVLAPLPQFRPGRVAIAHRPATIAIACARRSPRCCALNIHQPDGAFPLCPQPGLSTTLDDAIVLEEEEADIAAMTDNGGGDDNMGSGLGSGSGSGDGDNADDDDDSLPEDMHLALAYGSLTREGVTRYRLGLRNPLLRLALSIGAFRSRFLGDADFLFKILVQEIVGNGTALASEIAVRGREIVHELEYVASDLIVGTVVEAGFVWFLAPRLALPAASNASALSRMLSALPSNLFQPNTSTQTFSVMQRLGSFAFGGFQYASIGLAAGVVGTAITYGLIEGRKRVDKKYKPERPLPAVVPNALGWAAFMVLSGNTRFQLVEGLELGVAKMFARRESVKNGMIIALRLGNNYWGGVQFVKFFRYLGLHAVEEGGHGGA